MLVKAMSKNIRVSPEKARLVVGEIKKMPPMEAIKILDFVQKKSSVILKKTIQSAIANAKNNFGLDETSLKFKEVTVGKGMVFKRFRPVARGRAHSILKRTSHLTVVLEGEQPKKSQEVPKVSEVSNVPKGSKESKEPSSFAKASEDKKEEKK